MLALLLALLSADVPPLPGASTQEPSGTKKTATGQARKRKAKGPS